MVWINDKHFLWNSRVYGSRGMQNESERETKMVLASIRFLSSNVNANNDFSRFSSTRSMVVRSTGGHLAS